MELKTIKEVLNEMDKFASSGRADHIADPQAFALAMVQVLRSLHYKVEELERNIGPSSAFIDPNDVPHRLR